MIKIGLCDDNDVYINQLSKILRDISSTKNLQIEITTFNSGEDLIDFCTTHNDYFDLLFLDVLMGGINGINTAHAIREIYSNVYIVFVTSSKEYALDSYSVNAFSYILKPFSYDSIEDKFLKLYNMIDLDNKNKLYVKNNQDIYTLSLDNVVYFESNLRKITAHMISGDKIVFYNKMSNLENEINTSIFIRSHRSFLVNIVYIKNIINSDLITTTNEYLPISKKHLNNTRDTFTNYLKAKLSD